MLTIPIKLNIYDKIGITKTFIFITDSGIRDILVAIQKTNKVSKTHESLLKKTYGSNWKMALEIGTTTGGFYVESDIIDNDTNLPIIEDQDIADDPDDDEIVPGIVEHDFDGPDHNFDEQEFVTMDDLKDILASDGQAPPKPRGQQPRPTDRAIVYIFDECTIYPHDNIFEFKQKLAVLTDIPIYKQNIWYRILGSRDPPKNLYYNIYLGNSAVSVSIIDDVINSEKPEYIEDIPVLVDYYNSRQYINVKMNEPFTLIKEFTEDGAIREFNMYNMDDFVSHSTLTNIKDKNIIEIIYYGLIVLFWPMLTFSAWIDYIDNTADSFNKIYPEIGYNPINEKMFKLEHDITESAFEIQADIKKKLFVGITYTTILVESQYYRNTINIRNLFDELKLDANMPACKCAIFYKSHNIVLTKVFMDSKEISTNISNSIIIIRIANEYSPLDLYIYQNGTYIIKSKWREDNLYKFDDIFEITSTKINPVIKMINELGAYVIDPNAKMELMTIKNAKTSESNMTLIYREQIKAQEFQVIKNILQEYQNAGIVRVHATNTTDNENLLEYYFAKGMHKFNVKKIENIMPIDNYYSYLTNSVVNSRWIKSFQSSRKTIIHYKHGDIKITIDGIKDEEYSIFYIYMLNIFDTLYHQIKHYKSTSTTDAAAATAVTIKQNVKTLVRSDPALYSFKKLYDSPIVYSRLCQRKHQPAIITEEAYNKLSKTEKERVTKYWNFTTNSPAYYKCPNAKYPNLQFIIKKHPKDYCIPCCKIKTIDKYKDIAKSAIYNSCMEHHQYTKEKHTSVVDTRYIMRYGKYITPGRICSLPEETIEPLFYESFFEPEASIDHDTKEELEKEPSVKYYLYGIDQEIKYTTEVGYITSLIYAMDLSYKDFFKLVINALRSNDAAFKMLLNGHIFTYAKNAASLISSIESAFISPTVLEDPVSLPWNNIFIDIAYHYLNILSVIFRDFSSPSQQNIKLVISSKINKINLQDQIYKIIFLVERNDVYNPIFKANSMVYFKTKLFHQKLFQHDDSIVNVIIKIDEFNKSEMVTSATVTLNVYREFLSNSSNYKLDVYYVNSSNQCYYIKILRGTKAIYIPVKFSDYVREKGIESIHIPFKIVDASPFELMYTFIKDLNHWIATKSKTEHNAIRIDEWITLDNPWLSRSSGSIIGFICDGINYYHAPLSYNQAKKINGAANFKTILYHPDKINESLGSKISAPDSRTKNIIQNTYDYYIYELLLLEYITLLNKEKNVPLRHEIKKHILKMTTSKETIDNITSIITEYYDKYPDQTATDDIDRITTQINKYQTSHRDKKELIHQINTYTYTFDKIKINELKVMPREQLIKELHRLSGQIVKILNPQAIKSVLKKKKEDFPNILVSCFDEDMSYCKNNKLIITQSNLDTLLDIMASDILNPFKSKWMFNSLFVDNIISCLKFKRRPHETIEIYSTT
jgi:hypothetical protein